MDSTDWGLKQLKIKTNYIVNGEAMIVEKYIYVQWEMSEKRRYMGRVLKTEQNLDLSKHRELAGSVSATQSAITGTGS